MNMTPRVNYQALLGRMASAYIKLKQEQKLAS